MRPLFAAAFSLGKHNLKDGDFVKHVRLNNVEHKELRIVTERSARYGDNVNFALLVPKEIRTAQNFYPIFIQKDSNTGKFFFSALFGFQEGENLFLTETGWNAEYVPISILRQPFLIGQQVAVENGERRIKQVINLDIENARVNSANGEHLFTDSGDTTPFLNNVADMLDSLHNGLIETDQVIEQLVAYNLLEPLTLKVTFNEFKTYELVNLYTINEASLSALSDDSVLALYRNGMLEKIYSVIHSQARVSTLIRFKNEQDAR